MSADIVAAVRRMLLDDIAIADLVDDRVWGVDLDRGEVPNMPRKNIVITRGGPVLSAGSNSYIQVERMRLDIRCYGEDSSEASSVALLVKAFLKAMRPTTVDLAAGSVFVHNAVESAGPIDLVDPDTDWPFVWMSRAVHYSEVLIAAPLVSS